MRVLIISNFYPPHSIGGQEQSCQQAVEGLRARGHRILVLTSTFGVGRGVQTADDVHRALFLEMDLAAWRHALDFFTQSGKRKQHNLDYLRRVFREFVPEVVFVWGMWNLSRSIAALAEQECPGRVVYRFADYWPTLPSQHENYWNAPGRRWFSRLPKYLLRQVAHWRLRNSPPAPSLKFEHAFCVSEAVRSALIDAGISLHDCRVIYPGIDGSRILDRSWDEQADQKGLSLLYVGRLTPEKGVDVIIRALAELVNQQAIRDISLTIVGSDKAAFAQQLRQLVERNNLGELVSFLGYVPSADVPGLLLGHDILLVPSTWAEPFARVLLEGMAAGAVVIASSSGGSGEVVVDGHNGLLFSPGAHDELAQKILTVMADPRLRKEMGRAAQDTVSTKFTLANTLDNIERYLHEVFEMARATTVQREAPLEGVTG